MQTPKGYVSDELLTFIQIEENASAMSKAKSPEECYDIVKVNVDVTFEEFCEQMAIIKNFLEEKKNGLLSEEDLDAIAGGKSQEAHLTTGIVGGLLMGAATAAFAAS